MAEITEEILSSVLKIVGGVVVLLVVGTLFPQIVSALVNATAEVGNLTLGSILQIILGLVGGLLLVMGFLGIIRRSFTVSA